MARQDVEIGHIFQSVGAASVWIVTSLVIDAEGIPHARIQRSDDPTSIKTISVLALQDTKFYKRLSLIES